MEGAVHEEVHTPEVSALYPITCWYWVGFFLFFGHDYLKSSHFFSHSSSWKRVKNAMKILGHLVCTVCSRHAKFAHTCPSTCFK